MTPAVTRGLLLGVALVLTLSAGCRKALTRPLELAPAVESADAEQLREQAGDAFDARDEDGARRAADLYSQLAAHGLATGSDADRHDGLTGSIRARVWLADKLDDEDERRAAAVAAVNAGQLCERAFPRDAACAYWLAIAVGAQARERRSTAVDGLDVMEDRLRKAIEADPTLDHGGPHRVLALLYLRAPGWPTGPGDPDLGYEEAQAALAIDQDYPPNLMVLAEALVAIEETDDGREAYGRAREAAERWLGEGHKEAENWLAEVAEALQTIQ